MTYHEMELAELSPSQKKHYETCLGNGCPPKMALMLASKHGPRMTGSDQAFNEGARRKMSNIPFMNQHMFDIAKKAGINTSGKYHVSGLGGYDNPLAWVSTIEDARESIVKQNLNATGLINHTAVETPEPEAPRLAPDLVDAEVGKRIRSLPPSSKAKANSPASLARLVGDLREQVIAERGRPKRRVNRDGSLSDSLKDSLLGNR